MATQHVLLMIDFAIARMIKSKYNSEGIKMLPMLVSDSPMAAKLTKDMVRIPNESIQNLTKIVLPFNIFNGRAGVRCSKKGKIDVKLKLTLLMEI